MTRLGFFNADSEHAYFITAFELDTEAFPTWSSILDTCEAAVLEELGGSYMIVADADTMASDEEEVEWDYYSFDGEDLASKPFTFLTPGDDKATLALMLETLAREADFPLDAGELATIEAQYEARVAEEASLKAANTDMVPGTLVHLCPPPTIAYPDSSPIKFNPSHHDARQVLLDSDVDYSRGKADLGQLQTLPPHLAKPNGKYWAPLASDAKVYFMGQSKRALQAKASIYLAWVDKFGGK